MNFDVVVLSLQCTGIRMLQMNLVMEDKISLDELQEEIQEIEDYVQSTDVAGESSLTGCTDKDFS